MAKNLRFCKNDGINILEFEHPSFEGCSNSRILI